MSKTPLVFTYYIAAPIEKVWNGFVSKEANQKIFMGADFEVELTPGGSMTWSGPGKDGKPVRYVTGRVTCTSFGGERLRLNGAAQPAMVA